MKKVARFRGGGTSEDNSMESQNSSTGEKIGIRTTGRIKKAKIVFDPSDNYVPRTHRPPSCSTASTASTISAHHSLDISEKRLQQQRLQNLENRKGNQSYQSSSSLTLSDASGNSIDGEKCTICYRREPRKGVKKLIACIDCENNAHLSCMKIIFEDLSILRNKYRCDSCRTCASCFEGPEDGELVTCSKCVKSFHLSCHIPSVARFSLNSKWLCSKCITPKINNGNPLPAKSIRDIIIGDVKLPNSQALQQQPQQQDQQKQQPQQQQQQQQPQQQQQKQQQHQQLQQQQQQPSIVANKRNSSENMSHTSHSQAKQMKTATQQLPPQQVQKHPTIPKPQEKVQTQTQLIRPPQLVVSQASINVEGKIEQDKETSQERSFSPNELLTEIPDVKGWSIKKVVEFFEKYFPNEAHVFQEHEIDGQSLLLLKRSDVIKKLPLKLGPSLRIYNLILKIQSQSNDPTIGW